MINVIREHRKEDGSWDEIISTFSGFNAYQSEAWKKQKTDQGWNVQRIVVIEDNKIIGCAQMQLKQLPIKGAIVWIPGGILGLVSIQNLKKYFSDLGLIYYVVRASFNYYLDGYDSSLNNMGWKKAPVIVSSGHTMILETNKDTETLRSELSGNWRRNLKRSSKKGVNIVELDSVDPDWLRSLYEEIEERKSLDVQFSTQELRSILKNMKENIRFYKAVDADQNILAIRAYTYLRGKAWDLFAITTPLGRNCYASHALLWRCISDCAENNIGYFDLSGIDPVNNKGTYNFKKGTGAKEVMFHKEREYSNISLLRLLFNLYVKAKFN